MDPKSNSRARDKSDAAQRICVKEVEMALNQDSPARCPVESAARQRLAKTGYRSLGWVRCQFDDGTLTLHGSVPSYYHKQVAQEAIRNVTGLETIVNEINVWS
jgi:osmotically-inducible protein OsmY